ncbi:hypothetical protein SS50377_26519 [Spironucleus salmonicida]|uniref:Uncharacterized protein n=1 Tax=Spironucleus salmonicida TaxID=348837 RepID=V6LAE1_9EUKA|nr:hypothetical protein SS50377_26519 [Spironucleus salmonicida]|eukprot:EST41372.1 Hypothetical protein SS50377_19088 [Spironucleus salmonicida]
MIQFSKNYQSLIIDDTIVFKTKTRNTKQKSRSLSKIESSISIFSQQSQFYFTPTKQETKLKPNYIQDQQTDKHYENQFIEPYVVKTLTDTFFSVINTLQKEVVIKIAINSFNECKKHYLDIMHITQERIDEFRQIYQEMGKPRIVRAESIVRGPNNLEQVIFHKDYRRQQQMSITGNQKDFFHHQLIKYMRNLPQTKNNLIESIRQHVIKAIGIVKCWDKDRQRNIVYKNTMAINNEETSSESDQAYYK